MSQHVIDHGERELQMGVCPCRLLSVVAQDLLERTRISDLPGSSNQPFTLHNAAKRPELTCPIASAAASLSVRLCGPNLDY